jgi:rhodanese-related sulfurtransferase
MTNPAASVASALCIHVSLVGKADGALKTAHLHDVQSQELDQPASVHCSAGASAGNSAASLKEKGSATRGPDCGDGGAVLRVFDGLALASHL